METLHQKTHCPSPPSSPWQPLLCFLSVFLYLFWMFPGCGSHHSCLSVAAHIFQEGTDSFVLLICFLFLFARGFLLFEREIPDELKIRSGKKRPFVSMCVISGQRRGPEPEPVGKRLVLPVPKTKTRKTQGAGKKNHTLRRFLTATARGRFHTPAMQETPQRQWVKHGQRASTRIPVRGVHTPAPSQTPASQWARTPCEHRGEHCHSGWQAASQEASSPRTQ